MLKRYWIFIPFALVVALLGAGLFSNPKDMPSALVGKPVWPSDEEVSANPRSRSAVMRIAERTED